RRLSGVSSRLVISVHSTLSIAAAKGVTARDRLMPILARKFYCWADGIVAVSRGVAEDLARVTGIPRTRSRTVYNPIVTPELFERASAPLRHPWFQDGQPPVILAAGRLTPAKDYVTLIRAFSLVRRYRRARLVILGEGEDRPRLEALVHQ